MSFCGPLGWGPLQPGRGDDFTPCFQAMCVHLLPACFMLLAGAFKLLQIRGIFTATSSTEPYISSRVQLGALVGACLLPVVLVLLQGTVMHRSFGAFMVVVAVLDLTAWLIAAALALLSNALNYDMSTGLLSFWVAELLVLAKDIESSALLLTHGEEGVGGKDRFKRDTRVVLLLLVLQFVVCAAVLARGLYDTLGAASTRHSSRGIQYKPVDAAVVSSDSANWESLLAYKSSRQLQDSEDDEVSNHRYAQLEDGTASSHQTETASEQEALSGQIDISIASWMKSKVADKNIVRFCVRVTRLAPSPTASTSSSSFTVWKRFAEFKALSRRLNLMAGSHVRALPAFPASEYKPDLERRRLALEQYLKKCLCLSRGWRDMAAFLKLEEKAADVFAAVRHVMAEHDSLHERTTSLDALLQHRVAPPSSSLPTHTPIIKHLEAALPSQPSPSPPNITGQVFAPDKKHALQRWRMIGLQVPAWEKWAKKEDDSTTKCVFAIAVKTTIGNWVVHRTFAEIEEFHRQIAKAFTSVPSLSYSRGFIRSRDAIEERKRDVERVLQQVYNVPAFQCELLFEFLDNPANQRASGRSHARDQFSLPMRSMASQGHHPTPEDVEALLSRSAPTDRHGRVHYISDTEPSVSIAAEDEESTEEQASAGEEEQEQEQEDEEQEQDEEEKEQEQESKEEGEEEKEEPKETWMGRPKEEEYIPVMSSLAKQRRGVAPAASPSPSTTPLAAANAPPPPSLAQSLTVDSLSTTTHRYQLSVTRWSWVVVDDKKEYVVFSLQVREYYDLEQFIEWTVDRRFSEFEALAKAIAAAAQVPAPQLPPKTFMRKEDDADFMEQRAKGLETFIQQVVNTSVFQCDALYAFLMLGSAARDITFGGTVHNVDA